MHIYIYIYTYIYNQEGLCNIQTSVFHLCALQSAHLCALCMVREGGIHIDKKISCSMFLVKDPGLLSLRLSSLLRRRSSLSCKTMHRTHKDIYTNIHEYHDTLGGFIHTGVFHPCALTNAMVIGSQATPLLNLYIVRTSSRGQWIYQQQQRQII